MGDQVDHFLAGFSCPPDRDRLGQFVHLSKAGPVSQIPVHLLTDLHTANFDPSPMLVTGVGLLKGGGRISKIGGQIGREDGLILFSNNSQVLGTCATSH